MDSQQTPPNLAAGAILRTRRERRGLSIEDIANADGFWRPSDVEAIEWSSSVSGLQARRYIDAMLDASEDREGAMRWPR